MLHSFFAFNVTFKLQQLQFWDQLGSKTTGLQCALQVWLSYREVYEQLGSCRPTMPCMLVVSCWLKAKCQVCSAKQEENLVANWYWHSWRSSLFHSMWYPKVQPGGCFLDSLESYVEYRTASEDWCNFSVKVSRNPKTFVETENSSFIFSFDLLAHFQS